jgi:hypothetical protein
MTVLPIGTIALNWHTSPHFPHKEHFSRSTAGTGKLTVSVVAMVGFSNMWQFGSSTSQSSIWARVPKTNAKLVATVVLPVPPFPLATAIIIISNPFQPYQ